MSLNNAEEFLAAITKVMYRGNLSPRYTEPSTGHSKLTACLLCDRRIECIIGWITWQYRLHYLIIQAALHGNPACIAYT